MFRPALAAVAILFVVPLAEAQHPSTAPSLSLRAGTDETLPDGRLVPEVGVARVPLELKIGCGVPPSVEEAVVKFTVRTTAPYASVILNPPEVEFRIPPERCADTSHREVITGEALVTTARTAPALATFVSVVEATVHDENGVHGPVVADFSLMNDFLPLTIVNPERLYVKTAPGTTVTFPLELQNLGNGPALVEFDVTQPNKNKLEEIGVPSAAHLESRAEKGPEAVFKQRVDIVAHAPHTPAYTNEIYQFHVKLVSRYDGEITGTPARDEQTLSLAVQVQGVGAPSVSPLALIGAALLIALVLHRRP